MTWTFEIGQGDLRGYVSPMEGGGPPYQMAVVRPPGHGMLFTYLASVERAVEAFCTASAVYGQPVPIQARGEWTAAAEGLDARKGEPT